METQEREAHVITADTSQVTTDHDTIRDWIEAREGNPAVVRLKRESDNDGLLRVEFHGYRGSEWLEPIRWETFFQHFEDRKLAFRYQDVANGGTTSRFYQFVSRN